MGQVKSHIRCCLNDGDPGFIYFFFLDNKTNLGNNLSAVIC